MEVAILGGFLVLSVSIFYLANTIKGLQFINYQGSEEAGVEYIEADQPDTPAGFENDLANELEKRLTEMIKNQAISVKYEEESGAEIMDDIVEFKTTERKRYGK